MSDAQNGAVDPETPVLAGQLRGSRSGRASGRPWERTEPKALPARTARGRSCGHPYMGRSQNRAGSEKRKPAEWRAV